jgi:hypothetical protein
LSLTYTVAEGLAVGDPGAKGAWVVHLLHEGQGLATDVEDAAILDA